MTTLIKTPTHSSIISHLPPKPERSKNRTDILLHYYYFKLSTIKRITESLFWSYEINIKYKWKKKEKKFLIQAILDK